MVLGRLRLLAVVYTWALYRTYMFETPASSLLFFVFCLRYSECDLHNDISEAFFGGNRYL